MLTVVSKSVEVTDWGGTDLVKLRHLFRVFISFDNGCSVFKCEQGLPPHHFKDSEMEEWSSALGGRSVPDT